MKREISHADINHKRKVRVAARQLSEGPCHPASALKSSSVCHCLQISLCLCLKIFLSPLPLSFTTTSVPVSAFVSSFLSKSFSLCLCLCLGLSLLLLHLFLRRSSCFLHQFNDVLEQSSVFHKITSLMFGGGLSFISDSSEACRLPHTRVTPAHRH